MTLQKCRKAILSMIMLGAAGLTLQLAHASEETYPQKPVRMIIPFGPGGITDVAGRLIGQHLSDVVGQPVVIENRPGAGGSIAAQALASARPDGYTVMLGTVGTQVVNSMLYRKLSYDPESLTPISLVSNSPYVLAVAGIDGVDDLASLVAHARSHPGTLNFGSAGNGSAPHLAIELFKLASGTDIVHIPFKSGAEAVTAAVSGQVQLVIDALPVIEPHARTQRLKMLAIASAQRSPAAPDLPTSVEQDLQEFQIGSWNAIVAPPNTPAHVVDALNQALAEVFAQPELVKRLASMGIEVLPTGTEAYRRHVAEETEKWRRVIESAGTRLD